MTTEADTELHQELLQAAIERAREDFHAFMLLMGPVVIPEDFKDGRHLQLLAKELQDIENKTNDRLMIEISPGSMKSKTASVLYPAWLLGRHPAWQILAVSHTKELAEKFGREVRNLIGTDEYKMVFPETALRTDSRAAARWGTTAGGEYFGAGAGAAIAGFRGNIIIADDLISEQTAYSKLERERIINWWAPGLRSRLLPGGGIVLVNTRWHLMDVSGYLRKLARDNPDADQWRTITIPAILNEKAAAMLGLKEGTSYWPEMWSIESLLKSRENNTPQRWASLYMQNPTADGGNVFDGDDFEDWDKADPPRCEEIFITADTAFSTKETADYSAIQVWGTFMLTGIPMILCLGAKKGRWSFNELMEEIKRLHWQHDADRIVVENKASGQSIIQELKRQGLPVVSFTPDKDKLSRAYAAQPLVKSGRVWMPKAFGWAKELIIELESFPMGEHDDSVDALVMAVLFLRNFNKIGHPDDPNDPPRKKDAGGGGYWKLNG